MSVTEKHLSQHAAEMRRMSEYLIHLSYPEVKFESEFTILPLKSRVMVVDGYDLSVSFSQSRYPKFQVESIQIQSIYSPFLPFNVVCNIARQFLGSEHLSFADFVRNQKKIYCWTVRKGKHGEALPSNSKSESNSYEGFQYQVLKRGSVKLYGN